MNQPEDDPFGAFGDSDSDDESEPDVSSEAAKAQALLQSANAAKSTESTPKEQALPQDQQAKSTVDLTNLEYCTLKFWDDPLYLSSDVKLVSSLPFGGGRGYIATNDLKPGTLVMVEKAIMSWPDEQLGTALTLSAVHRLLHHPDAAKIVKCLEDFHPTKQVVDAPFESDSPDQIEKMLQSLQDKYKDEPMVSRLVEDAALLQISNCDGSALEATDILRLFLALRYNGLESGLYCHVAMINHRCQPNCVKFLPNSKESDLPENCSEVRTTKHVQAGECLSISYLPKIVSHASRRRHLWDQHRFDIGTQMEKGLQKMEMINGGVPPSSKEFVDENSATSRVERSVAELDALYHSTQGLLSSTENPEAIEHAKALEVSCLELYLEAKRQLHNEEHILLLPCLVLHLDACHMVLEEDIKRTILSHAQRCKLLGRTIATALHLLDLQGAYFGNDHYDVARTNLDLSQSIQELLAKSSSHLTNLETNRPELNNFRAWSTFEHTCKKEYERIKELYPRDAKTYLLTKEKT